MDRPLDMRNNLADNHRIMDANNIHFLSKFHQTDWSVTTRVGNVRLMTILILMGTTTGATT
jgi:hypothetical protein